MILPRRKRPHPSGGGKARKASARRSAQRTAVAPVPAPAARKGAAVYSTGQGAAPQYHYHRQATHHHQVAQSMGQQGGKG